MSACKPSFTAAERAILEPLAVRCIVAAVRQSEAEAAYSAAVKGADVNSEKIARAAVKADDAHVTTCRAGKAFARALRRIGGGK